MNISKLSFNFVVLLALVCVSAASAQQKGQWVPGQMGLNAGIIPDPGFTYANLTTYYSASQRNGPNGNAIPGITGTYSFGSVENIFYFVPKYKILGGYFAPYAAVTTANGSLVGDFQGLSLRGGGSGLADTFVQPVQLGWHLTRADINVGYAFMAPTGRCTAGASNNVGSGYWGNHVTTGTTVYLTKSKGTSANLSRTGRSTEKNQAPILRRARLLPSNGGLGRSFR